MRETKGQLAASVRLEKGLALLKPCSGSSRRLVTTETIEWALLSTVSETFSNFDQTLSFSACMQLQFLEIMVGLTQKSLAIFRSLDLENPSH